jgi:hypothetical protein
MKTKFNFLLAGALGAALLSGGCASEKSAPATIVINQPPPTAPVAPVAPTVAPAVAAPSAPRVFHGGLAVVRVDSEEIAGENAAGANAVDGNPDTIWHTQWQDATPECPHEIVIELEAPGTIKGFTYLPRQGESDHGDIKGYEFFTSNDGQNFGEPVAKGEFAGGKDLKTISFSPATCRFIRLKALSEINGEAWTSAAEIGVVRE